MDKLIINLAPTGMVASKALNPHAPVSIPEIVEDARRCAALGVSILHLHARDESGQPTYKKEAYARLIEPIRSTCPKVIICVSLSGRNFTDFAERSQVLDLTGDLKPDMASLSLASMNFSQSASMNSPEMIQRLAARMAEVGVKPELAVFDSGMLNYAKFLAARGFITPPFYFNFILGNVATAQARPAQLGLLMSELPPDSYWAGGGIGAAQLPMNVMGILYGNGVRVGLEDSLWVDRERRQPASNEDMVRRVSDLAGMLARDLATPCEVRQALGLQPCAQEA